MFEKEKAITVAVKPEKGLQLSQEEKDVLVGAFTLLLKIDMRENPHLYKGEKQGEKND